MSSRDEGSRRGDTGGASVELVILTPVILLLLLFVVARRPSGRRSGEG